MAERYLSHWLARTDGALKLADFAMREWQHNDAAFLLHQATERAYACLLLTSTFYFPKSHNVKFLRSLSEDKEAGLIEAWPHETKLDRRRFELLKRACVDARYSPNYCVTIEDLDSMNTSVKRLRDLVERAGSARIAEIARS